MLATSEIESYREDGLVIPRDFRLSETELDCLHDAVDSVIRANPDTPTDFLFNVHLDRLPPLRLVGQSAFTSLVTRHEILDMVEQLIGPDIINWATHLFCKQATTGREVPWHQDAQYWPIRPLRTCTVWVAIDRTTQANGALRYIPGSHKAGIYSHRTDNSPDLTLHQVIDDPKFEEDKARYAELEPGQISLHDVHLLHGSDANPSGERRAGFAIRYMPSTSVLRRDLDMSQISKLDWTQIPLSLVRGRNRHADNDLEIGHRSGSVG